MALTAVDARRAFVVAQVAALQQFDFVVVGVPEPPFDAVKVARDEGGSIVVEVGDRDPTVPFTDAQRTVLTGMAFEPSDGSWRGGPPVADPEAAADVVERLLAEVFAATADTPIDVRHGSDRDDHEAAQKLAGMRAHIEPVLTAMLDGKPAPQDADGDYIVDLGSTRVFVAPRAMAGRPPIIRVFAITNAGLNLTSELGLFLTRLNFGLMFGRFSIDTDHQAVWFDETLLGDATTDDELRFIIEIVATTAAEWDKKIAQMFGGTVREAGDDTPPPSTKPGEGGYL